MIVKAVQISLESNDLDHIFQAPSIDYIKSFMRTFWDIQSTRELVVEHLFSSMTDFGDGEFTKVYENFFENVPKIDKIFIEFGAPQFEGAISNRTFRVLLGFINFLRMKYSMQLNIVLTLPKKFADSSPGGKYLVDHMRTEMKNSTVYVYKEHMFLTSDQQPEICSSVLSALEADNKELFQLPPERLGNKIVCHLGKFQSTTNDNKNIYDFYDGSRASTEVYIILRDAFRTKFSNNDGREYTLLYDEGGLFGWFSAALTNAVKELKKRDQIKITTVSFVDFGNGSDTKFPDLILCPVVRSGKTLNSVVTALMQQHPNNQVPEIICLIYTAGRDSNEAEQVSLPSIQSGTEIVMQTVVQRGARGKFLQSLWRDTDFEPQSPADLLKYEDEFSSASMWGMLFETELTEEQTSRTRPKVSNFPDFLDLFEKNKPLFLHKIKAIENKSNLAGHYMYIIPDETVPKELVKSLCNEDIDKSIIPISPALLGISAGFGNGSWEEFEEHVNSETYSDVIRQEFSSLNDKDPFC